MRKMNRGVVKGLLCAILLAGSLCAGHHISYSQELEYEIIPIERNDPNDREIIPGAINDKGEVIGYILYEMGIIGQDDDDRSLPFIWQNGVFEFLPYSGLGAHAYDINNFSWASGLVVIQTGENEWNTTLYPIVWNEEGGYYIKYMPEDYIRGFGSAINDNNTIAGYMFHSNYSTDDLLP